ncbi:uncharacterized protein RBU33_010117 isoform 2-T2 [Hipposideros larvatus]
MEKQKHSKQIPSGGRPLRRLRWNLSQSGAIIHFRAAPRSLTSVSRSRWSQDRGGGGRGREGQERQRWCKRLHLSAKCPSEASPRGRLCRLARGRRFRPGAQSPTCGCRAASARGRRPGPRAAALAAARAAAPYWGPPAGPGRRRQQQCGGSGGGGDRGGVRSGPCLRAPAGAARARTPPRAPPPRPTAPRRAGVLERGAAGPGRGRGVQAGTPGTPPSSSPTRRSCSRAAFSLCPHLWERQERDGERKRSSEQECQEPPHS